MIVPTPGIRIDDDEVKVSFVRSSGPGGQNVNKVATTVQLRFDVANTRSLPDDVKARLIRHAGRRITGSGILIIEARQFRTQERNRQDALERLVDLIRRAAQKPKQRTKTKPTNASREKRIECKKIRGKTKQMRGAVRNTD